MIRPKIAPALLLSLCIGLAACSSGDAAPGPGAQGAGQGRPGGGGEDRPAAPVEIRVVAEGEIASTYAATATLEAEKSAELLSRVSGVVEARLAEEGDVVRGGQTLLRVDNDEYALRHTQAKATAANLRSRATRMAEMWEKRLISVEDHEALQNELSAAEATEKLAALELSHTRIRAPFSGRITRRLVDVGDNINVGTPVFEVADFDPLLARVHVPARQFGDLQSGQAVELILDSDHRILEGKITLVSPTIDPSTGTIKLTVEIPGAPAGVRPGDFAELRVVTELRAGRILCPRGAIISEKGKDSVFVIQDGKAQPRILQLGLSDENFSEVLEGLALGDSVMVKGQRSLQEGRKVRVIEPGA